MNGSGSLTSTWAFRLIIINVVIYFIQVLAFQGESQGVILYYFGLIPVLVIGKGFVWQIFSYMFLHGSMMHLFFNMYALLLFGIPIEDAWGSKRFLKYYMFTGIGAGVTILALNIFLGGISAQTPTIGASGAIFGLLLAFGVLFPDAQILLFFIIPIRAKFLVILYGGIELYSLMSTMGSSNISHIGHLGGILFGIIYFVIINKRRIKFKSKKLGSKFIKEAESVIVDKDTDNREFLMNLLRKVRSMGPESISDDDYQRVKLLSIMNDEADICIDDDFNIDDDYCSKCDNVEACIIRELKKYI